MFVHAAQRVDRIPVLWRTFRSCTRRLIFQVAPRELPSCVALCGSFSNRTCECAAHRFGRTLAHMNIAYFADSTSDLLFMHADMWVNVRAVSKAAAHPSGASIALTPLNGLRMRGEPVRDTCIPLEAMRTTCHGHQGNVTCMGHTWHCALYAPHRFRDDACFRLPASHTRAVVFHRGVMCAGWSASHLTCPRAAARAGIAACCIGWSDLLYLPVHAQAAFRSLSSFFVQVFHEVALPTILHHLEQTQPQLIGLDRHTLSSTTKPAAQALVWRRLPCDGPTRAASNADSPSLPRTLSRCPLL
jgi:hypothetical protein